MLGKFFDRILHEEEDIASGEKGPEEEIKETASSVKKNRLDIFLALLFFLGAVIVRLYFLYFVSDPQNAGDGWYGNTYHHWQIAYLTREVGLDQGFLRLWDLKGMEYFWGPLHPILMIVSFALSGSVSIENARILSLVFGSLTIVAIYFLVSKFWGRWAASASAFLAVIHPVAILNDTSGMLEPIGFFLLFVGLLLLESAPLFAGILWAWASLARAEAWMFGILLLFLSSRVLKKPGQLAKVFLGWVIMTILYMKYLLDYTGNPIYPIWWNYLANARGVWANNVVYSSYQLAVKPYLAAWFVLSLIVMLVIWWRNKAKSSVFLIFGFANWAFIGGFMGLTHYLSGFQPWFWYIRFFEFPYIFAGVIVSIFLFHMLPKLAPLLHKIYLKWVFWIPILLIALLYQIVFWKPILEKYDSTRPSWQRTRSWAEEFAQAYDEGRVLIPEGDPSFTYALVYFQGIGGKDIIGQMFDPFFYMEGDPYENWGENREIVLGWMKKEDITLILVDSERERYKKLFEREEANKYFEFAKVIPNSKFLVYKVFPERIRIE